MLRHIGCQFIDQEKRITCLYKLFQPFFHSLAHPVGRGNATFEKSRQLKAVEQGYTLNYIILKVVMDSAINITCIF